MFPKSAVLNVGPYGYFSIVINQGIRLLQHITDCASFVCRCNLYFALYLFPFQYTYLLRV